LLLSKTQTLFVQFTQPELHMKMVQGARKCKRCTFKWESICGSYSLPNAAKKVCIYAGNGLAFFFLFFLFFFL